MPEVLYERKKRATDRTVRCYLTLDCNSMCEFCSARVPSLSAERRSAKIPAKVWAEGINRRKVPVVLAGGEPFLYEELPELVNLIDPQIRAQVYTNGQVDVRRFVEEANRSITMLFSLHPSTPDLKEWADGVDALIAAGHGARFHVVKSGDDWVSLRNFLIEEKGYAEAICCGDQRNYVKSQPELNEKYPSVRCTSRIFPFGPGGYRYHCVTLLGLGEQLGRREHISEPDGSDWSTVDNCPYFGLCAACDNLIEGRVEYLEVSLAALSWV